MKIKGAENKMLGWWIESLSAFSIQSIFEGGISLPSPWQAMEEPIIFVICYTTSRNDSDLNVKRISMFVAKSRGYK